MLCPASSFGNFVGKSKLPSVQSIKKAEDSGYDVFDSGTVGGIALQQSV